MASMNSIHHYHNRENKENDGFVSYKTPKSGIQKNSAFSKREALSAKDVNNILSQNSVSASATKVALKSSENASSVNFLSSQAKKTKARTVDWDSPVTELDSKLSEERQNMIEKLDTNSATSWRYFLEREFSEFLKTAFPNEKQRLKRFELSTRKAIACVGKKYTADLEENKNTLLVWLFHMSTLEKAADKREIYKWLKNEEIGTHCSLFYKHYAHFEAKHNNFDKAYRSLESGLASVRTEEEKKEIKNYTEQLRKLEKSQKHTSSAHVGETPSNSRSSKVFQEIKENSESNQEKTHKKQQISSSINSTTSAQTSSAKKMSLAPSKKFGNIGRASKVPISEDQEKDGLPSKEASLSFEQKFVPSNIPSPTSGPTLDEKKFDDSFDDLTMEDPPEAFTKRTVLQVQEKKSVDSSPIPSIPSVPTSTPGVALNEEKAVLYVTPAKNHDNVSSKTPLSSQYERNSLNVPQAPSRLSRTPLGSHLPSKIPSPTVKKTNNTSTAPSRVSINSSNTSPPNRSSLSKQTPPQASTQPSHLAPYEFPITKSAQHDNPISRSTPSQPQTSNKTKTPQNHRLSAAPAPTERNSLDKSNVEKSVIDKSVFDKSSITNNSTFSTATSSTNANTLRRNGSTENSFDSSDSSSLNVTNLEKPRVEKNECHELLKSWALEKNLGVVHVNERQYLTLETIGTGGFSVVWKVMDSSFSHCALKKVQYKDESEKENIINEIALLQKLKGNHFVVELKDFCVVPEQSTILIVMECGECDFLTLLKRLHAHKMMDMVKVRNYWQQMLYCVSQVHQQRIVHGDLKPQNFICCGQGLKLIDFGIAKAIESSTTTHVYKEDKVGTLNYFSPEALDDSKGYSKQSRVSDVWSLGCILYQMFYGAPPFAHLGMYKKLRAIPDENHEIKYSPPPCEELLDVMKKCLVRDPNKRATVQKLLKHPFLTS